MARGRRAPESPASHRQRLLPLITTVPFAALLLAIAILPLVFPRWWHRDRNRASVSRGLAAPVAILFAGIFVTMVPALARLRMHCLLARHRRALGVLLVDRHPVIRARQRSHLSGILSVAQGLDHYGPVAGTSHFVLEAISAGAVLIGANTYIGNGPNFMVKAIAEHRGIKMPSFFGFAVRSALILLPLYVVVTLLFFK